MENKKSMYKLLVSLLVLASILISVNPSSALAQEKYYYKGANYSTKITNDLGKSYDSSSSVVIVSASAVFDGHSVGKERIRAYGRCDIVKKLTNASSCYVQSMSVRLSPSNSTGADNTNVGNFISQITPKETSSTTYFASAGYFIDNFYVNGVAQLIDTLIYGSSYRVTHSLSSNEHAGRVIYNNVDTSVVDVLSTVAYNQIEYRYGKTPKGVGATFTYTYVTSSRVYLTARADANYVLSIPGDLYSLH